jgi:hypothetical protein
MIYDNLEFAIDLAIELRLRYNKHFMIMKERIGLYSIVGLQHGLSLAGDVKAVYCTDLRINFKLEDGI